MTAEACDIVASSLARTYRAIHPNIERCPLLWIIILHPRLMLYTTIIINYYALSLGFLLMKAMSSPFLRCSIRQ